MYNYRGKMIKIRGANGIVISIFLIIFLVISAGCPKQDGKEDIQKPEKTEKTSTDDLDLMRKETSIDMNQSTITAEGKGATTKERIQSAISEIVVKNKDAIQYCYWVQKRLDSTLKGRVVVEFTINPAGEVIRVIFRKSSWGENKLAVEVERCIKNVISTWKFDPIDPNGGNVSAGATYVFD